MVKLIGSARYVMNTVLLHLDGARIFNALTATGSSPKALHGRFDSISVCLSKGLGSPIGSVLLGSKAFIKYARKIRKALGGGMRQVGYLGAAGLYALEHHIGRLQEDHDKAMRIQSILSDRLTSTRLAQYLRILY